MRIALIFCLALAACAGGNPRREVERMRRQLAREESGERTIWIDVDHPFLYAHAGGGTGKFQYKNRGARNASVDSRTIRAGVISPSGFVAEWTDTTESMGGGTGAQMLDLFTFWNRPAYPNRRLRFESRPGVYFEKLNLTKAQPGDAEPWTLGLRFELEGELDIIKRKSFNMSIFGNGRIGGGWGRTKINGSTVASTSLGYGWEVGMRAQLARWVISASWFNRTTELGGSNSIQGTEYGVEGAMLLVGWRW